MNDLAKLLQDHADPEIVEQSARYLVAELSSAHPTEMRAALLACTTELNLDSAIASLIQSPENLQNTALLLLSYGWADPDSKEKIKRIVPDAQGKLPVIEASLLALVTLYGLYLFTTKGKTRTETTFERKPDGSLIERHITEYHHPSDVLKVLPQLVVPNAVASGKPTASETDT